MPPWVEHAIFWHVYPLGFVGADHPPGRSAAARPPAGPARRLARLRHRTRGFRRCCSGPIFVSATHGYDTIDHFRIDPRLGDDADFDALIAAARKRGLAVVLDGVFNHVSRRHPAFRRNARARPRGAAGLVVPIRGRRRAELAVFEGHGDLVALNSDSPEVEDYVVGVMNHWLDRGAAGWRLDAAYAMSPRFWARALPRVRARHADAYVFAELIHGDYAAFVAASGVDSVTQYELWKAIWSSLNDRNFFELAWALERHNGFLENFVPQTFVGNHDVTRLASRLEDPRPDRTCARPAVLLGGDPSIYAGDEQGFRGVKEDRLGGDDAVRPEFPERPEACPGRRADLPPPSGTARMRRRHAWLHRAKTRVAHLTNETFAFETFDGDRRLMVALNVGKAAALPAPGMRAILFGRDATLGAAKVRLGEAGWAILTPETRSG